MAWEQWSGHGCLAWLDTDHISLYFQRGQKGEQIIPILWALRVFHDSGMEEPEREFIEVALTVRTRTKTQSDWTVHLWVWWEPQCLRHSDMTREREPRARCVLPLVSWHSENSTQNLDPLLARSLKLFLLLSVQMENEFNDSKSKNVVFEHLIS